MGAIRISDRWGWKFGEVEEWDFSVVVPSFLRNLLGNEKVGIEIWRNGELFVESIKILREWRMEGNWDEFGKVLFRKKSTTSLKLFKWKCVLYTCISIFLCYFYRFQNFFLDMEYYGNEEKMSETIIFLLITIKKKKRNYRKIMFISIFLDNSSRDFNSIWWLWNNVTCWGKRGEAWHSFINKITTLNRLLRSSTSVFMRTRMRVETRASVCTTRIFN